MLRSDVLSSLPVGRDEIPPHTSLHLAVEAGVLTFVAWQINEVQAQLISGGASTTLDVAKARRGAFHVVD